MFLPISHLIGGCKVLLLNSIVETGDPLGPRCSRSTRGPGTVVPPGALAALPSPPWCFSRGRHHERQLVIELLSFFNFLKHNESTVTNCLLLTCFSDLHLYLNVSSLKTEYIGISEFFKQPIIFCTFFNHLGLVPQTFTSLQWKTCEGFFCQL